MKLSQLTHSLLFLSILVLSLSTTQAQDTIIRMQGGLQVEELPAIRPSDEVEIVSEEPVTAVAIKASHGPFFLHLNGEKLKIPRDPDANNPTWYISLPAPANRFSISSPESVSPKIYLIRSGPVDKADQQARTSDEHDCQSLPEIILQSTWREGLPEPQYNRAFTEVDHVIIHHSAGSNNATDYYQVVRDIYLYHTGINGWSDIGYNYLLSPDGKLFAGRDPGSGNQLNVRGAHFCGNNSNTSGICLLGNYELAEPSDKILSSLNQLLSFSFASLSLDPFTSSDHSTGNLTTLAGHRDGCATLCPGENVYSRLNSIRQDLAMSLRDCGDEEFADITFEVDRQEILVGNAVTLENTTQEYDSFQFITPGGEQKPVIGFSNKVNVYYAQNGIYDMSLVIDRLGVSDTLSKENFIKVRQPAVRLFPNPILAGATITIYSPTEIDKVSILSLNGQMISELRPQAGQATVPPLPSGLYLVKILSDGLSETSKLIIR